jgi:uncharacterized damage-inducible protein DinB
MTDGIQFSELLDYLEGENRHWMQFFTRLPQTLDLPLDIAGDVRQLILYIFAVELFFANAVSGNPKVEVETLPSSTLHDLFGIGERAAGIYRELLAQTKPESWAEVTSVGVGEWKASRRKLVAQAFTHSIRHWAQISTYLRQQGFKQEWNHDLYPGRPWQTCVRASIPEDIPAVGRPDPGA